MQLDLGSLRALYKSGAARPSEVIAAVYDRMPAHADAAIWISVAPREKALAKARKLEQAPLAAALPLYGVPFAVQDNIDLAGVPTTAGNPAFAHSPARSAAVVQTLTEAGAIAVGKTNVDQFAAGLAGTPSPLGSCSSVLGVSSSGAALAVARGLASFALCADAAGAGLLPAASHGLVGLKPTRGALSTRGVVPACRSLDCVCILATNCNDAHTVWMEARGFDPEDCYSRAPRPGEDAAPWVGGPFSFGVPAAAQLEFFGDTAAAELYTGAASALENLGGHRVEIDFSTFHAASELLASGPWMAERDAALRSFVDSHAAEIDPLGGQRHRRSATLFGGGLPCSGAPAATLAPERRDPMGSHRRAAAAHRRHDLHEFCESAGSRRGRRAGGNAPGRTAVRSIVHRPGIS